MMFPGKSDVAVAPFGFRYTPTRSRIEGPAFGKIFRVIATLIVAGSGIELASLWLNSTQEIALYQPFAWFCLAWAIMAVMWFAMMRSRTWIDDKVIHQGWVWTKKVEIADLAYCKVFRIQGLAWLIAPRLYARTFGGKLGIFYFASDELYAEFLRIQEALRKFGRGETIQ